MSKKKTIVGKVSSDVLSFTVGKDPELDQHLAEVDCLGTAAHVTMLSKLSLKRPVFSASEKAKVISQLVQIIKLARKGKLKITETDQDVHLAVERILTGKLGPLGKRVHTARSRNDQVAVDLRLYGKLQLLSIMDDVHSLVSALVRFSIKNASVPMVGRTHLQPAMPSTVGLWASAYAEGLLDDLILLKAAFEVNDRSPLGSAAGYGVPLKIDRRLTSSLLGFNGPIQNVLYASNARGKCESVILSAISQVMITLSRFSEDVILYSMPEFGYFSLPKDCLTGSSIMPQKNNPDVFELVRGKAARVLGCASVAAVVLKGLPGGYNRDLQEIKESFMDGLSTASACVRILSQLAGKLNVNEVALLKAFTPEVFAADRAFELVESGMAFRDAYDYVKEHAEELSERDPVMSIRNRKDLLDPGLEKMVARSEDYRQFAGKARRNFNDSISKLLGMKYPGLNGR